MTYRTDLYNRYQSTFKARDGQSAKRHDSVEAIHPFRGWLPSDRRAPILDLGCGSGQLLYALQGLGYSNVAGVDIGPEQVKSARELGLNVEQADAVSYLAEHVGHFQLMLACDVLEHLTRDEALRFLQHARHAAVPGGCLLLRVPNASAPRGNVYQFGDLTHETGFSPNSLRQLCFCVGAVQVEIREDTIPANTVKRAVRRGLWEVVRLGYAAIDIVETGVSAESYTRNMVARIIF